MSQDLNLHCTLFSNQNILTVHICRPVQYKGLPVQYKGLPVQYKGLLVQYEGMPVQYKGLPVQYKGLSVQYKGLPVQYKGLLDHVITGYLNLVNIIKFHRECH